MTNRRFARIRRAYNAFRRRAPIRRGWQPKRFDQQLDHIELNYPCTTSTRVYVSRETALRWLGEHSRAGL